MIVGPTGVGKTKLSIELAKHYNTEIISGDSVQVYRELNIGSGKIKEDEKENIKHHLIDILDVSDEYSVYDFQKNGRKLIDEISLSNKIPIICGGTGLYIKALLFDYQFKTDKRTDEFSSLTNAELYSRLKELNDKELPDINNRKKLLRHLEIYTSGEVKLSKDVPLYDALVIGLTMDRDVLYERINLRVDNMIKDGLIDEVKILYDKGINSKATLSIGYKELYRYFRGEVSIDVAIDNIKKNSRHFAKRQYTWFNNQMNVNWIDVLKEDPIEKSIKLIDMFLKKQ